MAPRLRHIALNSRQAVTLSEFRGKKNVILGFYPAAFTGGCTKQMTNFGASLAKVEGMIRRCSR